MRPTPYVASLRVYEPLSAFDPVNQLRWSAIPLTSQTGREEQHRALRRIIITEPPALRSDGAHILDHDGKKYVSPWSTARRCWAALEDFKSSLPTSVTKFFISASIEEALAINSESVEDKVPHIISETWVIPPRWFSLFDPTRAGSKNSCMPKPSQAGQAPCGELKENKRGSSSPIE